MGFGQIADMQIVSNTGAVCRGVILSKNGQFCPLSGHTLRQKGDKVGRSANRELANFGRRVRTYGIEVAQQGHTQLSLGCGMAVPKQRLATLFGIAIGRRCGLDGRRLAHR